MIKLIVLGDMHLRSQSPANRKDNIFEAQMNKLEQVAKFAEENGADILQVGDFFDSHSPSRELLNEIAGWLYNNMVSKGLNFISVYGQHDLYMRSYKAIKRSPLNLLFEAGLIEIAYEKPILLNNKEIAIYGMSYGEDIPMVYAEYADKFSILLSHEPILAPKRLQKDLVFDVLKRKVDIEKEKVLREYDLLINGDWHYPYYDIFESNKIMRLPILNPGAMARLSLGDKERLKNPDGIIRKPGFEFITIDGGKIKFKRIDFACAEWGEIFTESETSSSKESIEDRSFKEFLEELKKGIKGEEGISFYDNVMKWLEVEKDREIKEIVLEALKYAKEKGNS